MTKDSDTLPAETATGSKLSPDRFHSVTLGRIQAEVGEWHREQWPDAPLEGIKTKLRCELAEYEHARVMYLCRISPENARKLEDEAADVLITILGGLERLPRPLESGTGPIQMIPFDFAAALARKWDVVRKRDYRGGQLYSDDLGR